MRNKLWNKNYILLLQGNAISTLGDVMYSVAIGYWVYQATGSSALMGIMSSISMFVTMFLSPFCGSIVDKCDRRCMIVGIDLVQGLIMLAVGVLAYINALSVPIVLLAALCTAFGSVFYSPAISTIMLDIIPRDDLVRGQSIHSGISSLIDLVGSAISGAMVAFFGVPLIVVINGLSNLYSAVTELFVRVPKTVQQGNTVTVKGVMRDLRCAAGEIISDKCLKIFVPCALILNLLGAGPLTLMLPFCLEKGFTVDMYGYLISIFSAAYVAGALVLGAVKLRPSARYLVMSIGFTLYVPCFVVACFAGRYVVLCIFAFLAGLFNCAGNTVFNAALMLALPNENRSAMLGLIRSASVGGTALSAVIYGFIGELFPLYIIFALGSAISLIPMIYLCFNKNTRDFMIKHSSAEI
ncbi:MAG: MFS transporter [Clostridia bacterium]|nr:MFS transporter [Clostridia bacterium]